MHVGAASRKIKIVVFAHDSDLPKGVEMADFANALYARLKTWVGSRGQIDLAGDHLGDRMVPIIRLKTFLREIIGWEHPAVGEPEGTVGGSVLHVMCPCFTMAAATAKTKAEGKRALARLRTNCSDFELGLEAVWDRGVPMSGRPIEMEGI